jgi:hypothetical protein
MAPQRKNKRLNVPGSRTPATYDLKNQAHFNEFKSEGFIPDKYNNYAELQDDFLSLVYEGMSDADAAEALGVDYRNVIGKGYLAAELSSQGIPRGISARTLREDIKPDERDYLIERFGKDWFDAYQRYRKLEWGDAKALKKDKELIEQFSGRPVEEFTSAKQEADVLRDRLAAAFGKGGRAGQVHRGHGVSAMEGASVGKANLMPESGPLNVGHGSNPRYDYNVMRNLNMSANDLQNAYDDMLQREGLTINPRRYAGNYVAADEALRELKQGTSMGNPQVTVPVESTQVDPRSIEWRDRRFFEIEQQLAGDYERSGMSPNEAAAKARQRVEEYALGQSTLFNTAQSRGGPVTVVQPGKPMPKQIGTVVGEQLVDPFGRPKVDRSGETKRETRAIYEPPSGAILAPSPAVTRSQSLGKTAAAIANREPIPAPKPQPKVGQPAVLNGKPVIWSGNKWMPVPAPKVKLKDTSNITPNPKPAPRVIPAKPRAAAKPPVRVIPSRTQTRAQGVPRNQESASMQIRRLQNATQDALFIYPGMGLPSNTLPGI